MAAKPQRFLFETSFDEEMQDAVPASEAAAVPTHTDEDLVAARRAAFAEGEAHGRAAAVDSIEARIAQGLGQAVEQIGGLTDEQSRFQRHLAEQAARLALSAMRKIMPEAARRDGLREITAVIEDCLRQLPDEPRVAIRVAEEVLEPLRPRVEEIAGSLGYDRSIVLTADPDMGPADCRVEWADGGAERLAERVWNDIDEAIGRIYGAPPDPASQTEDEAEDETMIETEAEPMVEPPSGFAPGAIDAPPAATDAAAAGPDPTAPPMFEDDPDPEADFADTDDAGGAPDDPTHPAADAAPFPTPTPAAERPMATAEPGIAPMPVREAQEARHE